MRYRDLLKDPRWKTKRDECIEAAGHACEKCGSTRNLQVHHPHYERGKMPWEYDNLIVLCAACHTKTHFGTQTDHAFGGRTSIDKQFFHSFGTDGFLLWQGRVLGHVQDGFYLVQLFSWIDGEPSNCEIVHFNEMIGWMFYQSPEQLIYSWEHGQAKRHDRHFGDKD